ncbi:MAG: hypothetical protein RQ722_02235 [Desulfuromonadales bacterium]|nr:hypothetical protein [Desulfuromonadales bacterium]
MKKFILICLCNAALLVALCLPAQARMTIGMMTEQLSGVDRTSLDQLGKELARIDGTSFQIRRFEDAAAIGNWLLRFQEIDAAVVTPEFIKQQPAGALKHLADMHAKNKTIPPMLLVIRHNLSSDQAARIKTTFLKLSTNDSGRKVLEKLGLAGVTPPGEALRRKSVKLEQPLAQPSKEKSVSPPVITDKQPAEPKALKTVTIEPKRPEEGQLTPAMVKGQPAETEAVTSETVPETTVKTAAKSESAEESSQTSTLVEPVKAEELVKLTEANKTPESKAEPIKQEPLNKAQSSEPEPAHEPAFNKRLVIFAALILLLAILLKACLFAMRWQNKRKSSFSFHETPQLGTAPKPDEEVLLVAVKKNPTKAEEFVIETGHLGPGKVPALLKRCADLPRPVVLKITKGSNEKLVYFAGGQVSGVLTQNAKTSGSGVRWNKLGNLLVREGLITKEQSDQGMALITKESGLRFGEALLKLRLIDLAGFRHALARQAKATIYALILFPEGRYQVLADDGSLPPEESVSIEVTNLLREASYHQSEWTAIRQALPNLNTLLDFTPDGSSKLENVSISAQQQAVLLLIDGQQTINDLCIESSMMDYEVYRFLYLMTKAGVLEQRHLETADVN